MQVEFYEKPGCLNNTRQKQALKEQGHKVIVYSLLSYSWTYESLRPFFGKMPVSTWFNMSSPRIKSGEVDPKKYNEKSAIAAMLADPILIRRPLIRVGESSVCGFENEVVKSLINYMDASHLQNCPKTENPCK